MKSFLFTLSMISFLMSCKNRVSESSETQTDPVQEEAPVKLCFAYDHDEDLMGLTLNMNGTHVSGQLVYALSEKDRNSGMLEGDMHGDTLFADYIFASEGRSSIREVAFLKRDNYFIEGFGDVEKKDGKMVFKNRSALNFQSNFLLRSVPCQKPPSETPQ